MMLVFCLILLRHYIPMSVAESIAPPVRSLEVPEKYVLSGGAETVKSNLFSQCIADALTVEGVLNSIMISEEEGYVRFVPKEKMDFEWTKVDLRDTQDTVQCALEAFDLKAYMFKFDGSCNVALNSSYDPKSEQACDGAATEVVYITSRPLNIISGQIIPLGEYSGCFYSTQQGMTYGVGGSLVSEVQLSPADVCCPTADKGYCLIKECVQETTMTLCEAEARCKARGIPMASKSFYEADIDLKSGMVPDLIAYQAWTNLQEIDSVWQWMPEMVEFPASEFESVPTEDTSCASYSVNEGFGIRTLHATSCDSLMNCVLCYDANSSLPQC